MITPELRDAVRHAYDHRCGYCGVHEEDVGSELEIDHFQPRSAGGTDEFGNLIYCCTACNRHKGWLWVADLAIPQRLLHPRRDDLALHLREEEDGQLTALTVTGAFHIARLRLNRPARVAARRRFRSEAQKESQAQWLAEYERNKLQQLMMAAERIRRLFAEIDRFSNP
jgi:hypothetical protein